MIPLAEETPVLRVPQVAEILGVGESTLYDSIARGEIPSIRVGRRLLVPTAALRRMLGLDATNGAPDSAPPSSTTSGGHPDAVADLEQ